MKHLLSLVVLACFLSGCAASVQTTNEESYRQSAFTEDGLRKEGIAILPVVAGQGVEGFRRPFGKALNQTAEQLLDADNVLRWQNTMDQLNERNLTSSYNETISTYQQTSIIDKSLIEKMSKACGQRYFLFVRLAPPKNVSRQAASSINQGSTYQQKYIGVGATGQVWDAQTGDVVWEGTGTSSVTKDQELEYIKDQNINAYSQNAARALVRGMLGLPATAAAPAQTRPKQTSAAQPQAQSAGRARSELGVRLGRDFGDVGKFSIGGDWRYKSPGLPIAYYPSLDYYFLGEASATNIYGYSASASASILQLNANVLYPFSGGSSIEPYVGGGLALNLYILETEVTGPLGGSGSASETTVGISPNLLGGTAFRIGQSFRPFVEAQYTFGVGVGDASSASFFALKGGVLFRF